MSQRQVVSETIDIAADPRAVYAAVSDPDRMGRWSPECAGAVVAEPGRAAYVGMRFTGRNRFGRFRWRSRCTVTAAEPGELFAFTVDGVGIGAPFLRAAVSYWEFRLEPLEGGTRVVQMWRDRRPPLPEVAFLPFDVASTGGRRRIEHNRETMRETLRRLKADLEQPPG